MNYLQLCQSLRAEAGLSGSGPASVVGQSGMYGKLVDWVQEAYAEILDMHPWSFLWTRATPVLTIGQTVYTGADFDPAITDLGRVFASQMLDISSASRPRILWCEWSALDRRSTDGAQGPPRYFTRRPDDALVFYPVPDDDYEIQIDYQRAAPALAANDDLPLIPDAKLHKIIVYKALEYYGQHNEDMGAAQHGARQFAVLLSRMADLYTPAMRIEPAPLDQPQPPSIAELV